MKTLAVFLLSMVLLQSCNNTTALQPYRDAPTQFIVTDILPREGMVKMSTYYVEVVDANDLVRDKTNNMNLMFWFCDSTGKYKLGQPIHFDKTR
jgi:hypothetical protein